MYSGDREVTGQGLRIMANGFSGTVFPLVAALWVGLSWRYPFLLYGLAFPVTAAVFLWFEEPTTATGSTSEATGDGLSYRRALARLLRHRRVYMVALAHGLPLVVWLGFLTYNSLIVVHLLDGSAAQAGVLAGVVSFVLALVGSQACRVSAWFDSRLVSLVGANLCSGAGFLLVLFAPGILTAVVGVVVFGTGFGLASSLYRSILTDLGPESLRAGLVSVAGSGSRVLATLTPVAMGGVIAAATPALGFGPAIRLAGIRAIVVGIGGSIACLPARRPHRAARLRRLCRGRRRVRSASRPSLSADSAGEARSPTGPRLYIPAPFFDLAVCTCHLPPWSVPTAVTRKPTSRKPHPPPESMPGWTVRSFHFHARPPQY